MRQRQRQGHCDSRYFPPPLHCRVGITGEEGTLLHNTICGRQSVNQSAQQLHSRAAEEDPGVFALATNKRRGGEDGLCCSRRRLSLPLTHGHCPVARLTSSPLARSPLDGFVFSVMVYLGHVAGRPRARGEREVRGVRAATVAALLQVSPLSAKASLMNVVPCRVALLAAFRRRASTSQILARTHRPLLLYVASKQEAFRFCRHPRINKSSLGTPQVRASALMPPPPPPQGLSSTGDCPSSSPSPGRCSRPDCDHFNHPPPSLSHNRRLASGFFTFLPPPTPLSL